MVKIKKQIIQSRITAIEKIAEKLGCGFSVGAIGEISRLPEAEYNAIRQNMQLATRQNTLFKNQLVRSVQVYGETTVLYAFAKYNLRMANDLDAIEATLSEAQIRPDRRKAAELSYSAEEI